MATEDAPGGTSPKMALLAAIRARSPIDQVVGDPDVSGQDHIVADPGASRDTDARHDQAALPDLHVVPHLHQVVDLGSPAHHRIVDAAAVDAGVGAHLDLIPQDTAAHMRNPVVSRSGRTDNRILRRR